MAKTQIKNYVFKPGIGAADNLYPDAYNLLQSNKSFIQKESAAWIQDQIDAGETGFVGYTYNQEKCERDIGYNVDAYLKDLRYGGNENTYNTIKYYWDQDVAQIDGDRQPEIQTYGFIKTLINTYILQNTAYSASNVEVTQTIDLTKTAEAQAITNVDTLLDNTVDVITNGLSSMPTLEPTGVGTIKIQGRHDLDELLLITNVSKNEIIYNFSSLETGGLVSLKTDSVTTDTDFAAYLQTTDAITTITLNYNTSSHTSDDELQIFVEKLENGKSVVTTRPYDFGSDAIERLRVAQPLSMLDADFEYGLQPTKWAAIGTLRGYPSVYEIPGTDAPVLLVETDASAGTDGVGQSLITVTTVSPHGYTAGTPITIKALEDGVNGAARAEGSFVIVEVTGQNTFTYYAKSKVGTLNGEVISTTYTQLREAGFYTGASIGNPVFSIASQGTSGSLVTQLGVLAGSDTIPFDGTSPETGAPLVGLNLPTGAQITGVLDQSQGGGTFLSPTTIENTSSGSNELQVESIVGIPNNLAIDRGDGFAIYVSGTAGNTISFNNNFTANFTANKKTYSNISGTNDNSTGNGAAFDISHAGDSSSTYVIDAIANDGLDYEVGDKIVLSGADLGGSSPDNDLTLIVDQVGSDNSISAISILEGAHSDGTFSQLGVSATYSDGQGTDAFFTVQYENGNYTLVDINSPDTSSGYVVGDKIRIPGSVMNIQNGVDGTHDLFISVDAVGLGGSITSLSFDGAAPPYYELFNNVAYTTSGAGSGAVFDVELNGGSYTVTIPLGSEGIDFVPTNTITVLGTDLGGTSPANDLTITVDNVDGTGGITAFSTTGTAINADTILDVTGDSVIPSEATFDISLAAGVYDVTLNNPGQDFNTNQQLTIPGTTFGGSSPTNDITITITGVDDIVDGTITTISFTGTGFVPATSYTNVSGTNSVQTGSGSLFNVSRNYENYDSIIVGNTGGADYQVGDRIVISGEDLDGISPINDITLRVTGVTPSGEIQNFVSDYIEAFPGDYLDLICTTTISEVTTGNISAGESYSFAALATIDVTFTNAHGLVPGNTFIVNTSSDDGSNNHDLAAGSFFVSDIPATNQLRYQARAAGAIDLNSGEITGEIYPRPDSFFIHRPYDGGVQLGTGGPQHGAQAIRQSKKYIRYQSGKGIMYTTGALFAPSYDLRSVVAEDVEAGSIITVTTDDNDHGVQEGGIVRLLGIETPGYNSGPQTAVPPNFDYEVTNVIDERTFQIRSQRRLGSTDAVLGFGAQMSVVSWHGATVRSGIFDDQNGIFWEYDGTQISVVQRTGARQLAGTVNLAVDNNLIAGTNTRFRDQLKAGDKIIIKGMTHTVSHVLSQNEITVTPDWRGVVDISGAKVNLVVDKKVKQRDFNLDRLDGTGPSGYNLDEAKMQMIGIQYSWYGAGFIDFMVRGADGNFVFAHRMRNSNVNTEAFMRSGNLPVRYEVSNEGPPGKLAESMNSSQTSLTLTDSSFFPESGTLYIDNEIITFNGKNDSTNQLLNLQRSASYENFQAGASRQYTAGDAASHDDRTGVILISQTITPLISHWGSAFITDGQFDDDRGYIFSYTESGIDVSTTKQTAFLIRLSPSVSNALVGDLGERELLNRAQLLLQELEVTSDTEDGSGNSILGGIVVEGVLNPKNYPTNPANILWQTLSSEAQGGQPSFAQIAAGASVVWSTGEAAVTTTATAISELSTTMQTNETGGFNREIDIDDNEYDSNGPLLLGAIVSSTNNSGQVVYDKADNATVERIDFRNRDDEYRIRISRNPEASYVLNDFTFFYGSNLINTNFVWVTKASFDASGATTGTEVTGGSVTFPPNTRISNVQLLNFGGTEFYRVIFNNPFSGTFSLATGTIEFTFLAPPFAQPGETIFSFIAQPGERSTVDFSELKELTNTPLGGRGTFPNGPDVLAINVYKTSGTAIPANLILKWGEAQA